MKTPEEFLEEKVDPAFLSRISIPAVIEAMKEYARLNCRKQKQQCAASAKCEEGAIIDLGFEIIPASVNRNSILNCPIVIE